MVVAVGDLRKIGASVFKDQHIYVLHEHAGVTPADRAGQAVAAIAAVKVAAVAAQIDHVEAATAGDGHVAQGSSAGEIGPGQVRVVAFAPIHLVIATSPNQRVVDGASDEDVTGRCAKEIITA